MAQFLGWMEENFVFLIDLFWFQMAFSIQRLVFSDSTLRQTIMLHLLNRMNWLSLHINIPNKFHPI